MRIRGGTWTNTDDEVLKAAVMKYGENQWSRVSSLLVSKSARQCKARWDEWLESSVVKTEWTREETETLLQLARSLPAQWRTAAPAVECTASRYLDGYEKLLDAACSAAEDDDHDPRNIRPEDIDRHTESRPTCSDPADIVGEEKAILSWACARLGSLGTTRGKRAKRKARQKLLEEANRFSSMRMRSELTAAGIATTKSSTRSRWLDYNAENAFQKRSPPVFNDAADEDRPVVERPIEQLQGRRADMEAPLRKQDSTVRRAKKLDKFPEVTRKAKLMLSPTRITGHDLEDIATAGYPSFDKLSRIKENFDGGPSSATFPLLVNYSQMSLQELSSNFYTPESTTGRNVGPVILEEPARKLHSGTSGLPQSKYEHRRVFKSVPEEDEKVEKTEEDMLDRVASEMAEEHASFELQLEKRTKVLRGELPRLSLASWDRLLMNRAEDNRSSLVPPAMLEQANELVNRELFLLLEHDNAKYPLDDEAAKKRKMGSGRAYSAKSVGCIPELEVFDENELKEAEFLVKQETELLKEMGHKDISPEDFVKARNTCLQDLRFFPGDGSYGLASVASDSERLDALRNGFDNLKRRLDEAAKTDTEPEQQILALSHASVLDGIWTQMEQSWRSLQYLNAMQRQEHLAAASKVKCLIEVVNKQRELQRTLQRKYGDLLVELERINMLTEACPVAET